MVHVTRPREILHRQHNLTRGMQTHSDNLYYTGHQNVIPQDIFLQEAATKQTLHI